MQEEIYYLYKITNLVNNKLYIGITKDPVLRQKQHFTKMSVKNLVAKAVKKYGRSNFKFEVLCIGSKEYISDLEEKAIQLYNSHAVSGHGYNLASGGYGGSAPRSGKVVVRKDDVAVYASGFWFPNKRTVLTTLNWTGSKFRYRRDIGVLGDTCNEGVFVNPKNTIKTTEVYYRGFWFPSMALTCSIYNVNSEVVKKEIRNRRFEESSAIQDYKIVRKYLVHNAAYSSLEEAAKAIGISEVALKGRYNRKKDLINYSYTYIKETK